jgi:hypothetical protein
VYIVQRARSFFNEKGQVALALFLAYSVARRLPFRIGLPHHPSEEDIVTTPQGDRKVGKIVLSYLLVMRDFPRDPGRFPLTGGYVQRISRRLGCPVGEHRALRIIRQLEEDGVVKRAGSYRQAYRSTAGAGSFRVRLYRLSAAVKRLRPAASKASVRGQRAVKAWWKHGMFGFGVKSYPRGLPKALRRWREPLPTVGSLL